MFPTVLPWLDCNSLDRPAALECREPGTSASQVLGLKVYATIAQQILFLALCVSGFVLDYSVFRSHNRMLDSLELDLRHL